MKNEKVLELIAEGQGKEHPILFSAPMVRAILNDTKTQTRRVVKEALEWDGAWHVEKVKEEHYDGIDRYEMRRGTQYGTRFFKCPFGNVGDKLWVRETWQYVDFAGEDNGYVYRATDPDWETMEEWRWKPSIFMPRKASRIELVITDIRTEWLNHISENDAIAEGVEKEFDTYRDYLVKDKTGSFYFDAVKSYKSLWQKINGRKSWDSNPIVWVISFYRTVARGGN